MKSKIKVPLVYLSNMVVGIKHDYHPQFLSVNAKETYNLCIIKNRWRVKPIGDNDDANSFEVIFASRELSAEPMGRSKATLPMMIINESEAYDLALANKYVSENEGREITRMYEHHLRSFMEGRDVKARQFEPVIQFLKTVRDDSVNVSEGYQIKAEKLLRKLMPKAKFAIVEVDEKSDAPAIGYNELRIVTGSKGIFEPLELIF